MAILYFNTPKAMPQLGNLNQSNIYKIIQH